MRKIIYIITILLLFLERSYCAFPGIYTIENLEKLSEMLRDVSENDLVLFDVDYVLINCGDKILRPCGEKLRKELRKKIKQLEKQEKDFLDGQTLLNAKVELVDLGMPAFIEKLQKKSQYVIGFTSSGIGPLGPISSQEELRLAHLRQLGIDFSSAFPAHKNIYSMKVSGLFPVFYQGILFTIPDKKGESLMIFLNKIKFQPRKIIFIDDRIENIRSVAAECIKNKIEFVGLHYIAAASLSEQADEKVARYQYDYLIKNKRWLSDAEAKLQIEN
ncbi:MAG: DUF2608 domain-containing protein [Pseudomonadota bacterium]